MIMGVKGGKRRKRRMVGRRLEPKEKVASLVGLQALHFLLHLYRHWRWACAAPV